MSNKGFRKTLLASTMIAGMSFGASPAFAQADQPAQPQAAAPDAAQPAEETIVVTGTLIRNPNLVSSAPVAVVGSDEIALQSSLRKKPRHWRARRVKPAGQNGSALFC